MLTILCDRAFDNELISGETVDVLHADASEIETINLMTEGIGCMSHVTSAQLQEFLVRPSSITRLRNFASFVAREETFMVNYKMHGDTASSVPQKVLCISKNTKTENGHVDGFWMGFVNDATRISGHKKE